MKRHPISVGDMVRALRLLEARDDATHRAIARVLGFDLATPTAGLPVATRPAATKRIRKGPPEIEPLVAAAAERKPV